MPSLRWADDHWPPLLFRPIVKNSGFCEIGPTPACFSEVGRTDVAVARRLCK